ncbi:MAG: hypothetical protein P8P36_06870 [Akkermansiaceae bacterium]|nr:hypothetical protein [Akkermansiaceae bacterium]
MIHQTTAFALIGLTTIITLATAANGQTASKEGKSWRIDSTEEWNSASREHKGLAVENDTIAPTGKDGAYHSKLQRFKKKRSAQTITLTASTRWDNWEPTKKKVCPPTLGDAPIFIAKGPNDYWILGRYKAPGNKRAKQFTPEPAKLDGFDIELQTTPFPNLFNAPGGLKKNLNGYNAWQSRDMVNWVHHGSVTAQHAKWSTTAEFVDGKAYIYYDFPNDQDPHLYIDDDLTDGVPGEDVGLAFKDPSDGSDCVIIRDLDGKFHLIYEDWSPLNAGKHSWDSPLAGHAVSEDGKGNFKILAPAVDERSKPTGKFKEYPHPHWHLEDPENFPAKVTAKDKRKNKTKDISKNNPKDLPKDLHKRKTKAGGKKAYAKYEVHQPEQHAYGDWAAIAIGGQYYLTADYHPAHQKIRIALFTSPSLDEKFEFIGELGSGHPDPDIGFAAGNFYLLNQTKHDYVSPGPWVETVTARVGVDTSNDGKADIWSDWQELKESYDHIEGFSKQIKRIPASMDLSKLPEGYGFCFELKLQDTTENASRPILESLEISFK